MLRKAQTFTLSSDNLRFILGCRVMGVRNPVQRSLTENVLARSGAFILSILIGLIGFAGPADAQEFCHCPFVNEASQ